MSAVRARLAAAGCTEWRLEVDDDNAAALALYRNRGFEFGAAFADYAPSAFNQFMHLAL